MPGVTLLVRCLGVLFGATKLASSLWMTVGQALWTAAALFVSIYGYEIYDAFRGRTSAS